jgi:hypothetical protein
VTKTIVSLQGQSVELRLPSDWERDVQFLFGVSAPSTVEPCTCLTVAAEGDGRYAISEGRRPATLISGLSRPNALIQISESSLAALRLT